MMTTMMMMMMMMMMLMTNSIIIGAVHVPCHRMSTARVQNRGLA